MKKLIIVIVVTCFYAFAASQAAATIPALPKVILAVNNIDNSGMTRALQAFCKQNGCSVEYLTDFSKYGIYAWNINLPNGNTPISIARRCSKKYLFCVSPHGDVGSELSNRKWLTELIQKLEEKGAKVTHVDCKSVSTNHGPDWVCANGKPFP